MLVIEEVMPMVRREVNDGNRSRERRSEGGDGDGGSLKWKEGRDRKGFGTEKGRNNEK